jgi:hypothetical protein
MVTACSGSWPTRLKGRWRTWPETSYEDDCARRCASGFCNVANGEQVKAISIAPISVAYLAALAKAL